jgi:hypothetical protein
LITATIHHVVWEVSNLIVRLVVDGTKDLTFGQKEMI